MSTASPLTVLVVGATGSIGRLAVAEALRQGHTVRALVRPGRRAHGLPAGAEVVEGELTRSESLSAVVDGVDAVVFTHGSSGGGRSAAEQVDYGAVRNVLRALNGRRVRVALMTAIGVTDRAGAYNRSTGIHDWKRRGERLLRASGLPYTIVRPGWFDYNARDQHHLTLLQGDTRHAGDPSDGVVARQQIAEVLVSSLTADAAIGKTFELVADKGPAQQNLAPLFAALKADRPGELDAVLDVTDMPLDAEPASVREDLAMLARKGA
jgi:uncharacterized protein YbjT (DUF2867 family)